MRHNGSGRRTRRDTHEDYAGAGKEGAEAPGHREPHPPGSEARVLDVPVSPLATPHRGKKETEGGARPFNRYK